MVHGVKNDMPGIMPGNQQQGDKSQLPIGKGKKPERRHSISDLYEARQRERMEQKGDKDQPKGVQGRAHRSQSFSHHPEHVGARRKLRQEVSDPAPQVQRPPQKQQEVRLDINRSSPEYRNILAKVEKLNTMHLRYPEYFSKYAPGIHEYMHLQEKPETFEKLQIALKRNPLAPIRNLPPDIKDLSDLKAKMDWGRAIARERAEGLAALTLLSMEHNKEIFSVPLLVNKWMLTEDPLDYGMSKAEYRLLLEEAFNKIRREKEGKMIIDAIEKVTVYDDDSDKVDEPFGDEVGLEDLPDDKELSVDPENSLLMETDTPRGTNTTSGEPDTEGMTEVTNNLLKKKKKQIDNNQGTSQLGPKSDLASTRKNVDSNKLDYIEGKDDSDNGQDQDIMEPDQNLESWRPNIYRPGEEEFLNSLNFNPQQE